MFSPLLAASCKARLKLPASTTGPFECSEEDYKQGSLKLDKQTQVLTLILQGICARCDITVGVSLSRVLVVSTNSEKQIKQMK